jgi:hypothetical protein
LISNKNDSLLIPYWQLAVYLRPFSFAPLDRSRFAFDEQIIRCALARARVKNKTAAFILL